MANQQKKEEKGPMNTISTGSKLKQERSAVTAFVTIFASVSAEQEIVLNEKNSVHQKKQKRHPAEGKKTHNAL